MTVHKLVFKILTKQCNPISNNSMVPVNIKFETREKLSTLDHYTKIKLIVIMKFHCA